VENKTLTDEIYAELVDGLKTGLDWTQFLAKHGASKGPLYNAIGRFFNDMEAKVRALSEVQAKLDAAGLELDSLDQKIKEAEGSLAPLEDRRNALNDQVKTLETRLAEKSELAGHLVELGKLGFDIERLKQLREALTEIGVKHGFKGKEAVSKFFDDLKDYDARIGFEREIQRLETITGTKKLEAEKWQAEADSLARRHKDLSEAITAAQTLIKHGVNIEQIVSWNGIVSKLGGAEALQDKLGEYKSMSELLNARKEEAEAYGLRLTKAQSQLETLQKERAKIEAAIDALKVAGVKKLQAMAEATEKQLKAVAASEIREAQAVGQEVRSEFVNYFAQLDKLLEKAVHLGQELERSKQELQRYEGVKDALESHAVAAEAEK
jgi:chromosome segregation ATPase